MTIRTPHGRDSDASDPDEGAAGAAIEPVPPARRRVIALAAAAGLVPLNSTMIAVALPAISDAFEVSTATVSILITSYLVIMFVGQPVTGRLGDRIGNARLVRHSLIGFLVASSAAALAPTFWFLVAARGLQAAFAAALGPGIQSLLTAMTDDAGRGRVFGILGSVQGVGAASGPVVGGVLIQLFGWPAVFVVNIPIVAIAIVVMRSIDPPLQASTSPDHGHRRGRIANEVFVAAYAGQALSTFAQYALLLLTPLILDARGWGPGAIGLALSSLTIGMIVMGPRGGDLGDRLGRRLVAGVGLAVTTCSVGVVMLTAPAIEPAVLIAALAVFGTGLGATTPNLMSAALGSVPVERTGAAAGALATSRYVGSIGSTAAIGFAVDEQAAGSSVVLAVATACLVAAVLATTRLPSRRLP